jgi:two-component system phosphate regulon sensor histidine kinase PhoR
MKRKIFLSILSVSLITILLMGIAFTAFMHRDRLDTIKLELAEEASYVAMLIQNANIDIDAIGKRSKNRITIITQDGTVVYDSFFHLDQMANHLDRPEVQEAFDQGIGKATRFSDNLLVQTCYYALRLNNGSILRMSSSIINLSGEFTETAYRMIVLFCVVLIMVIVASWMLTKSIMKPINNVNLSQPLLNPSYDELMPLLRQIEKQQVKIKEQFTLLSQKQQEFDTITDNMNEGLIIFSTAKTVLSANKSARELFQIQKEMYATSFPGVSYLFICRDEGYIRILESAFSGLAASVSLEVGGQDREPRRLYQLSANPVSGNAETGVYAAVLFIVDITEQEKNEKIRREFTANVSHELKTPLTSIMGYAEIMKNGIAKPEDSPHFAQQIYTEASRLLAMIEDIIRLSQFDENTMHEAFEPIELYTLCETVIRELAGKAEQKKVHFTLEGQSCPITGLKQTMHDMIYNLCDNAIIYNKPGGSVLVTLSDTPNRSLSVKDTGIGIAEEHQGRVFERFYRIDKSRSKASGGTGLGLAIVKHAAQLHHAQIQLNSEPGIGTEIQILF